MTAGPVALRDVLRAYVDARLLDVHTALIGKVVAVYPQTRKLDVQPACRRTVRDVTDGSILTEALPMLPHVPLGALRAGHARIDLPVNVGDWVVVIVPQDNIGKWQARGGVDIETGDIERHGLTGSFALPLLYPDNEPLPGPLSQTEIVMALGPTELRVGPAGVNITGPLTVTGEITTLASPLGPVALSPHTHYTPMGETGVANPVPDV